MMRGSEFSELRAFVTVAQERSFRKAAARLGVTPSALSHVIRSLEERHATKLLHRTTRSVAPTQAGETLLARLLPALSELEEAVGDIAKFSARPTGRLRLNAPRLAAEMILLPRLAAFTQRFPGIALDLVVDDGFADIVAEGFDAGIRSGELVQRDMIAVRLTPDLRPAVVASPSYLAARPLPKTPHDLRSHRCVNYRWPHNGATYRWHFARNGEALDVVVDAALTVNDTNMLVSAALQGSGFTYILEERVSDHLAAGHLVRVLEDWCQPMSGFHLYYSGRRHVSPPLRALIDFLRQSERPAMPSAEN